MFGKPFFHGLRGMSRPSAGITALLVASFSFGSAAVFIRLAQGIPPMTLSFLRLSIAAVVVAVFSQTTRGLRLLTRRELFLSVGAGLALSLHFFTFIYAVQNTSVANATFLVNTSPIFLAVMAPALIHERTLRVEILSIVLAVGGILLVARGNAEAGILISLNLGDIAALLSALSVSLYTLIGRKARTGGVSASCYISYVYSIAAIFSLPLVYALEGSVGGYSQLSLMAALGLAIIPTVFGHGLYNYALATIKAVLANIVPLLEPVIASGLAILLFEEAPSPMQILGYVLTTGGVIFAARSGFRPSSRIN